MGHSLTFACPDGDARYRDVVAAHAARIEQAGHEWRWLEGMPDGVDDWVARIGDADGILLNWALPGEALDRCPNLRVIAFAGTGAQRYVDLDAAARNDVLVCNTPDFGANAVAEHSIALMLAAAKRLGEGERLIRSGGWDQYDCVELRGKRLGVVGAGAIALRVVELAGALGMDVLVWTRNADERRLEGLDARFATLEELFETSDVVSLHLAHTPATEGIVSESLLARLPAGAIVVNTARAEIVDNRALAELSRSGRLAGVAVDVFDPEPPTADEPIAALPNAVLSPHVGNQTPEALDKMFSIAVDNLLAFAAGDPRNAYRAPASA